MLSSIFFLAGAFATIVSAQTSVMASSSVTGPPEGATSYPIEINNIPLAQRQIDCQNQMTSCFQLCEPGGPSVNNCTAADFSWTCTCASGNTPNLGDFNQTIPFFECQEYVAECVAANTDSPSAQRQCQARVCGGPIAAVSYYSASSSVASSTTMSTSSSASITAAATTTTSSSQNSGPIMTAAKNYGLGAFVGGVAVLGLAL